MDHKTNNQGAEDAVYADGSYRSATRSVPQAEFGIKVTKRDENDQQTPYNYQGLSPYYNGGPYNYLDGPVNGGNSYPQYNQLVNIGAGSTGRWVCRRKPTSRRWRS